MYWWLMRRWPMLFVILFLLFLTLRAIAAARGPFVVKLARYPNHL
ncbi:MAG: hypothetical protein QM296_12685 [Bacillota bacterium]|nr:hypothetical protein [Bacillota bacterium]